MRLFFAGQRFQFRRIASLTELMEVAAAEVKAESTRYRAQLKTVDADRQRMEQLLLLLWGPIQSQ
jgi:hypothetical protein